MPDIEILNLKQFSTLDVLSKLEGLWLNRELELIYAVACRITWICPMTFDSFPLDVQVHLYKGLLTIMTRQNYELQVEFDRYHYTNTRLPLSFVQMLGVMLHTDTDTGYRVY